MTSTSISLNNLEQLSKKSNGLLVITGATGWVGRTALHELQLLLPPDEFRKRVRAFASRQAMLTTTGYSESLEFSIPIFDLSSLPDLAKSNKLDAVFHSAFLTRDKLSDLGTDYYISTNRWITTQVREALDHSPDARAVIISSGAASVYDGVKDYSKEIFADPYGVLKKEEEEIFMTQQATCLIMRIYALSGRFIRNPMRFALGDFLLTALRGESIQLLSTNPVLRSYANAGDIALFAWHWLLTNQIFTSSMSINAVTFQTNLLTLANKITEIYQLPPVQSNINPEALPDKYMADNKPFLQAMGQYALLHKTLEKQLQDTIFGLINYSNQS